jgi:hypothetical protein
MGLEGRCEMWKVPAVFVGGVIENSHDESKSEEMPQPGEER